MKSLFKPLVLSTLALTAARSFACDLCGCYIPSLEAKREAPFSFYTGVAEQFTHFGTDRFNGHKLAEQSGQYLDSSHTQFVIGASFLDNRFALQVNIPLIYRSYQRPEGFAIDRGHESGLGDVSLLANFRVFKKEALFHDGPASLSKDGKSAATMERGEPDFSTTFNVTAGLKFPTGDSRRIREEFAEVEIEGAPESGIHGHDLALGTGSYDGVFGAQFSVRYQAVFFQADAQYTWRGYGRHSYRFANDLSWNGGPGVFIFRKAGDSLALQAAVSGETKSTDRFLGEAALDTGITSLYLGPQISGNFGRVSGEIGVDFPLLMNTTAFQTSADYRIRAAITLHF